MDNISSNNITSSNISSNSINNNLLVSSIDKKLNKRQYKFIEYVNKGLSISEAYKLAGYKGTNPQSCYQLSHSLKGIIANMLEEKGFNKNRLMIEVNRLLDLPLEDTKLTVTFREKLQAIRMLAKCLPETDKAKQTFTRFTIVNNIVQSDKPNVVDVKPLA